MARCARASGPAPPHDVKVPYTQRASISAPHKGSASSQHAALSCRTAGPAFRSFSESTDSGLSILGMVLQAGEARAVGFYCRSVYRQISRTPPLPKSRVHVRRVAGWALEPGMVRSATRHPCTPLMITTRPALYSVPSTAGGPLHVPG